MSFTSRLRRSMVLLVLITISLIAAIALPASWYLLRETRTQEAKSALQNSLVAAQQDPRNNQSSSQSHVEAGVIWSLNPKGIAGLLLIPMTGNGPADATTWAQVNNAPPQRCVGPETLGGPKETALGKQTTMTCDGQELFIQQFSLGSGHARRAFTVVAGIDYNDSDRMFGLVVAALATTGILVAALVALLSGPLSKKILRPVADASQVATAIAAGDTAQRLTVHGNDQLATMCRQFNAMTDSLTATINRLISLEASQRQFVSDVAHELRTPAATLVAAADSLDDPSTRDEAATMIAPQLRRLSALIEGVLEISRMDAGRAVMTWDEVPLKKLICAVVQAEGLESVTTIAGDIDQPVLCDPRRVTVVMRNLLANAHIHGKPPISITLESDPIHVSITVKDAGVGLPRDFVAKAFDRFSQGDLSRHHHGSGLGLALARDNARLHRIQKQCGDLVWDEDQSCFIFTIPLPAR